MFDNYRSASDLLYGIALIILAKHIAQSETLTHYSPLTFYSIQALTQAIEEKLLDNLPASNARQKIHAFPNLHEDKIAQLNEQGIINASSPSSLITIPSTQRSYQVFYDQEIGRGGLGTTYLGQDLQSGEWVAIKIQFCRSAAKELNILTEAHALLQDHKLLGLVKSKQEDRLRLTIIMPLFSRDEPLTPREKISFLCSVAESLKNFHEDNRIHGDIHMGNVCWNKAENKVDLIDYGSLMHSDHLWKIILNYVPKAYETPESFYGSGLFHVKSSDTYGLGCLADDLLGEPMLPRLKTLIKAMKSSVFIFRPSLDHVINELRELQLESHDDFVAPDNILCTKNAEAIRALNDEAIRCKCQLMHLESKLAAYKKQPIEMLDFKELALLRKETEIYFDYLERIDGAINLLNADDRTTFNRESLLEELETFTQMKNRIKPSYQSLPVFPTTLRIYLRRNTDQLMNNPAETGLLTRKLNFN